MQTQGEIRGILDEAGLTPRRRLGQCFLIDRNLMAKLVELADLTGAETVLEVGAGTGSLTEELLARARRVVAVEIDRGLFECLRRRLGAREHLRVLLGDALAGKHAISPAVLEALAPAARNGAAGPDTPSAAPAQADAQSEAPGCGPVHLVSNLPYSIATPLVAECLVSSFGAARCPGAGGCRFERLTFTVQREVADRLAAGCGSGAYGPVSVLVSLLGRLRVGSNVPPTAFWPRPQVASRIVRIDFDAPAAELLASIQALQDVLRAAFTHRRKQIGWIARNPCGPYSPEQFGAALAAAGIDRTARPEAVEAEAFRRVANVLAGG